MKVFFLVVSSFHRLLQHRSRFGSIYKLASFSSTVVNKMDNPTLLDKSAFSQTISLVSMKVPHKLCSQYLSSFKEFLFERPKIKRVYDIEGDKTRKLILLNESIKLPSGSSSEEIMKETVLHYFPANLNTLLNEVSFQRYDLKIGYDYFNADEILKKILPSDLEVPSSFEQAIAGHIAHLNLRDEILPFKSIVGQVILDKNPHIRTVVTKVGSIETEFRTFPMEVIAGVEDFNVTLKESGAKFSFNFATVYWNSRLQMEHSRIIDDILKQQKPNRPEINKKRSAQEALTNAPQRDIVVADMMAGVGPFAVPLAMANYNANVSITVHANDLNPESFRYLELNKKQNNCAKHLQCYNMDGRKFILKLLEWNVVFDEVIMNLPQTATEFLDVFIGLQSRLGPEKYLKWKNTLPRIHVYAFSTDLDNPVADVAARAARVMQCSAENLRFRTSDVKIRKKSVDHDTGGGSSSSGSSDSSSGGVVGCSESLLDVCEQIDGECSGHIVRDVSPKKVMVCLSFRLPRVVALASVEA